MAMDYYRYQENEEMSSEQTESMFLYRVYGEIAKRKNRRRRKKKKSKEFLSILVGFFLIKTRCRTTSLKEIEDRFPFSFFRA